MSLRNVANIAFETVPVFIWSTTAFSRQIVECFLFSVPLSSRPSVVWCPWFCAAGSVSADALLSTLDLPRHKSLVDLEQLLGQVRTSCWQRSDGRSVRPPDSPESAGLSQTYFLRYSLRTALLYGYLKSDQVSVRPLMVSHKYMLGQFCHLFLFLFPSYFSEVLEGDSWQQTWLCVLLCFHTHHTGRFSLRISWCHGYKGGL